MSIGSNQRHKPPLGNSGGSGLSGIALLSLSLYIILLAFFIVLNSISHFSEPKVSGVFESLDLAFSIRLDDGAFEGRSAEENTDQGNGQGDSIEDMQAMLKSLLPGLDSTLTNNPNGGHIMMVRMEKDKFARLSSQLLPVFARILGIKDGEKTYRLHILSAVRDTLSDDAYVSFRVIEKYKDELTGNQLSQDRVILSVEQGNPAFLTFRFDKVAEGL